MDIYANQFCEVTGHRLAYRRRGDGETILLVHGITIYIFIWQKLIQKLSSRYDAIVIDLLGCRNPDKPLDESYSIKRHTALLHDFVN